MKERKPRYGLNLLICLGTAFLLCAAVEFVCQSLGIAPLFTPNLAFNEKVRFIRDHRPGPTPIGIISGGSIAMNDIDSDLLQEVEHQPFINLGANALPVKSAQHLYNQLAEIVPVREVILAVDPLEMHDAFRATVDLPDEVFRRYILGRMTWFEEFRYRDLLGLFSYWKNWSDYHSRKATTSMAFSNTGSVPLDISRENAEFRLWSGETIEPEMACARCTDDLDRFCRQARSEDKPFTVVLGPTREEVLEHRPEVRAEEADRLARIQSVLRSCGGILFDAAEFADFDDACFANSLHLNEYGMHALTEQFLRFRRGEPIVRVPSRCAVRSTSREALRNSPP